MKSKLCFIKACNIFFRGKSEQTAHQLSQLQTMCMVCLLLFFVITKVDATFSFFYIFYQPLKMSCHSSFILNLKVYIKSIQVYFLCELYFFSLFVFSSKLRFFPLSFVCFFYFAVFTSSHCHFLCVFPWWNLWALRLLFHSTFSQSLLRILVSFLCFQSAYAIQTAKLRNLFYSLSQQNSLKTALLSIFKSTAEHFFFQAFWIFISIEITNLFV